VKNYANLVAKYVIKELEFAGPITYEYQHAKTENVDFLVKNYANLVAKYVIKELEFAGPIT
jgi:hypothetical protein